MRPLSVIIPAAVVAIALVLSACSSGEDQAVTSADTGSRPVVYAVNEPLHYFAARLAGAAIDLRRTYPEDGDPAFADPDDELLLAIQQADLLLANGADYAKWRQHSSLPARIVVDTSAAFADELIQVDGDRHSHGAGEEHDHGGVAFTTWMDYSLAAQQAAAVQAALIDLLPGQRAGIAAVGAELQSDLEQLDAAMLVAADDYDRSLLASHPIYQYFARRYELDIHPLLWEPEMVLDAEHLAGLEALLDRYDAGFMLWEGEPRAESIEQLEEYGLDSLVVDPGANTRGDWLALQQENVDLLTAVFSSED